MRPSYHTIHKDTNTKRAVACTTFRQNSTSLSDNCKKFLGFPPDFCKLFYCVIHLTIIHLLYQAVIRKLFLCKVVQTTLGTCTVAINVIKIRHCEPPSLSRWLIPISKKRPHPRQSWKKKVIACYLIQKVV